MKGVGRAVISLLVSPGLFGAGAGPVALGNAGGSLILLPLESLLLLLATGLAFVLYFVLEVGSLF